MGYGAADDIVLKRPNSQNQGKKGKAGKVILTLFLLIIILGGAAAGYWYYTNYILETPKDLFLKYVGNSNFQSVLDMDVYYNMLEQMSEKSFFAETTADLTTTMKNDLTEMVDSSKFDFALNISADRTNKKSLLDAKVTYSSNDLFNLKVLNTKESIGIASEDILDKYIGSRKSELDNSLNKATGKETDISADILDDTLNNISNNKIEMEEGYRNQKIAEYSEIIYNLIPEEAVTKKENVVATIDTEAINTDAYTLTITSDKYQEILKTILEKLKNDDELLNQVVTGEEIGKKEIEDEPAPINTITNIQTKTKYSEGELDTHESEMIVNGDEELEFEAPSNQLQVVSKPETDLVNETSLDTTTVPSIDLSLSEDKDNVDSGLYQDLIKAFVLGQKIDGTVEDLKEKIDYEFSNISSIKEGIVITIYIRNEDGKEQENVKLVAELPTKISLDIEYVGNNKFKFTYLTSEENDEGKEISTGYSVEVEKKSSDVNVKYNIQYGRIENKKVVSKTQVDLQTNTANPSKGYTNSAIIKYNNSEGDLKVNIKNEIKFQSENIPEELTDENTIFLDTLSEEEAENLYIELFQKVMAVYAEKMLSLSFIDNNSSNSVVQQPVLQQADSQEKETIKSKLIETVSNMMGEAEQNGELFTIENLKDLSIEGYDVSSIVSTDLAIIKINGYTFNIDKDFMLSE